MGQVSSAGGVNILGGWGKLDSARSFVKIFVESGGSFNEVAQVAIEGDIVAGPSNAGCREDFTGFHCPFIIQMLELRIPPFSLDGQDIPELNFVNEGEAQAEISGVAGVMLPASALKLTAQAAMSDGTLRVEQFINPTDIHGGVWQPDIDHFQIPFTIAGADGNGTGYAFTVLAAGTFRNRTPSAVPGADQTIECQGPPGIVATLDGTASEDIDGGSLRYLWEQGSDLIATEASATTTPLTVGDHAFVLTVKDNWDWSDQSVTTVKVVDTAPPTLTCPPALLLEADPNTCVGTLPDITSDADASDVCSPASMIAVGQSPPAGTILAMGEHLIELEATDEQGLKSVRCPTLITVSLPINRNPNVMRFLDAKLGQDFLRVHGRIAPCLPLDPSATDFEITLSNASGQLYHAVLPAGAVQKKGSRQWLYKDRNVSRTHAGIRGLRIVYSPRRQSYDVRFHGFEDMSLASESDMTLQLRFGANYFANTSGWTRGGFGWYLRIK